MNAELIKYVEEGTRLNAGPVESVYIRLPIEVYNKHFEVPGQLHEFCRQVCIRYRLVVDVIDQRGSHFILKFNREDG